MLTFVSFFACVSVQQLKCQFGMVASRMLNCGNCDTGSYMGGLKSVVFSSFVRVQYFKEINGNALN